MWVCKIGREVTHAILPGWQAPCPRPATHTFFFEEDGKGTFVECCEPHFRDLQTHGVVFT